VIAGLAIAFTAMFSMPVFILLIAIAVAAFLGYRAFKYNKEQYPPLYDTWSRSWHCNKCGNIYSVQ
jgi:divalent metal cation (Fe/Co/Zn/Cd) transporter